MPVPLYTWANSGVRKFLGMQRGVQKRAGETPALRNGSFAIKMVEICLGFYFYLSRSESAPDSAAS